MQDGCFAFIDSHRNITLNELFGVIGRRSISKTPQALGHIASRSIVGPYFKRWEGTRHRTSTRKLEVSKR